MDQETLLRRTGEYTAVATGERRPPLLAGRRHAFAEWHVGLRDARGWRSFTSRSSGDLDRNGRIELGVDGETVAVLDNMVLLYLAPALSAPLQQVEPDLLPPVAELAQVWHDLSRDDAPLRVLAKGTPWVEVYLLETGRPYHARRAKRHSPLPPGAGSHSYFLLELSDRPFADWPGEPAMTPRSAGRVG